jgi:membrane protease YdiL (CAAX protease family)
MATITSTAPTPRQATPEPPEPGAPPQYSLRKILAVWAAAALPMAFLAWVLAPIIAGGIDGPNALTKTLLVTLTGGLIWQFVLVMVLVRREQGTLRWSRVKDALWLNAPRSPKTGRRGGRLWLMVIPLFVLLGVEELVPQVSHAIARDVGAFFGTDAGEQFLSGSWGWFAVIATLAIFNTAMGEELLFRGLLLPRMAGVFGRRDWIANGILFAAYHLHVPWVIPGTLMDTFITAYPSRRYRSAMIGIVVHSLQSVFVLALCLHLVTS